MKPFTQLTQAAPCVCHGRGYVINAAGDFAACTYCEAGEAFAEKLQAIKAQHTAAPVVADAPELAPAIALSPIGDTTPDLAPALGRPARVVPSVVRRQSAQVPGLVLERRAYLLTFRVGPAFLTYDVTDGQLHLVDGQDGGYLRPREREHIKATAKAYARKVAA